MKLKLICVTQVVDTDYDSKVVVLIAGHLIDLHILMVFRYVTCWCTVVNERFIRNDRW